MSVKTVPRRPATVRRRPEHWVRPPVTQRIIDWDHWGWLGPPPRALHLAGWALLVLRGFLGFTFFFAGLQKLANPAFFDPSNAASIQAQLHAAARRSPIHSLVAPLVHVAVPVGVVIALAELAVGIGTLLGLWARLAAVGGMILSVLLFLAVSFHARPYYTGSDIVFAFAWTPLLLAGSGGVLSADALLANRSRRQQGSVPDGVVAVSFSKVQRVCGSYSAGACEARHGAPCEPEPCPFLAEPSIGWRHDAGAIDRRTFALKGAWTAIAALLGLLAAGVAAGTGRLVSSQRRSGASHDLGSTPLSPTQPRNSPAAPPTTAASRPSGTRIGPASAVPVGDAASFQDPRSGDPSLVVQPTAGTFLAFDAVCPHAGCVVQYDPSNKVFVCPCHSSVFNGRTGDVEVGPAASGLTRIAISKAPDGQLYVT